MVREVVREAVPSAAASSEQRHQEGQRSGPAQEHPGEATEEGSRDLRLPPSPGVEYDDLPDLQEVQEEAEPAAAPVYQVGVDVSHQERRARAPPPPPDTRWLIQLAHIATGPQSPLLQERPPGSAPSACASSCSSNLHSYARPVPRGASPPAGRQRSRKSSECGSAVSTRSSLSDEEDVAWSISWPPTAWHCFLKGTRVRFHGGSKARWQDVEELDAGEDEESLKAYGSEGLRLVDHAEVVLCGQAVLQLTFDPGAFGQAPVTARCRLDHPFYVKGRGWSSFCPSLTVVHHGIPCYDLEVGAVCLPPGHRDAKHADDSPVFDTFRSYDFTPLDSSAVYVLSSMAKRRRASRPTATAAASPDGRAPQGGPSGGRSPRRRPDRSQGAAPAKGGDAPAKCKRPMNAFMLFAKRFRVEYTHMYPGKDNRAISVLLGEKWKKMRSEERRVFTVQAKALADEQKRLNPDCWKRKRTNSGCQGN